MRAALSNLNADLVAKYPNHVCCVTSDEGPIGRGHLSDFQDLEERTPVILTTSQMLTTGVDAPTCRNVVLARVVGSMREFKQIIGRGTRLREDYGKLFFNIIDYTGTATAKFADPDFDGDPVAATVITIDADADADGVETETIIEPVAAPVDANKPEDGNQSGVATPLPPGGARPDEPRKFYVDGGTVEVVQHHVYELDSDGKRLTARRVTDYTGEKLRTLYGACALWRVQKLVQEVMTKVKALRQHQSAITAHHRLVRDGLRPSYDCW